MFLKIIPIAFCHRHPCLQAFDINVFDNVDFYDIFKHRSIEL